MSWLELDDGILDHPKFIRAVKIGGDSAVFLWLGLRAYCGKQLTDGFIPADMLDEVRGPKDAKRRAAALAALIEVRLLEQTPDGVQMHNYLKWSRARADVLESRRKNSERQAKSRGSHAVTDSATRIATARVVTPSVTTPSPLPLPSPLPTPIPEESKSAPAHPDEQATWDGSERETLCPLDLGTRAASLKIPEQLAESLKVDLESVRESIREFVSYWTIGAGMGQKRRHWMRKLRESVRKTAGRPGGLAAPGAIEHQQRRSQEVSPNVDHETRRALASSKRLAEFVAGVK